MAEIQITARDRFGNRIRDGGVPLSLAVLPMDEPNRAVSVQGEVQDHSDGRYTARYTVTTAGRHALSLTIAPDDAPLHGSPYLLLVAPSPPHAARCACFAPRVGHATNANAALRLVAGDELRLGLRIADRYGNATPFDARLLEISIDEVGVSRAKGGALAPASEYTVRAVS